MAAGISSQESNYIKIGLLIYKISQRVVRIKFDLEFHPDCLQETLNRSSGKLRELQRTNRINHHQLTSLLSRQGKPSSEEFDITLMICLIRNLTDLQISNTPPLPTRVNVGDDLSRIHHYRNKLAHTNSFIIEDDDFNDYWEDIAQAVQRLGGSSFTQEIIALKEMPISVSQKAEYLQCIRIQNRLTDVEEKLVELTDKFRILEAQQNYTLPKHIRDLFEKEIKKWKNDDEKFFETSASRNILDVVKTKSFTIISGNSGMGKTAIAHHIALHLKEHEGYQILPISDANDIEKYYSKESFQIVVIDDICGRYSVDQYLINLWDRVSNKIGIFRKENEHFRILATCRLQITKNPQFERLSTKLKLKECSLLSRDFASTYVESQKIASFHMSQEQTNKLSRGIIQGLDMFPFLCGMFGRSENKDFRMFECPISYFEEQFDQMQYQNEGCFLGLALLVIYNDRINTNVFQGENTNNEFKKIFEEVFESLGLSHRPSKLHVLASLRTLIGTYTIHTVYDNDTTIITTKHGKIFELLSLYFVKKMTKVVIKYASPGFISSRIQFESIDEEYDEFTILIPLRSEHLYFSRMEMEINSKNFHYVFGNKQSHFKSYQEKFISFFSGKEDIMKIMLQNKWPLYLSSLYGCCILLQFLLEQAYDLHPNARVTTKNTTNVSDESSFEISTEDMFIEFDYHVWSDCRIKQNNAPLVAACEEGYFEIVQTLVKYGYDIDFVNPNLKSPLMTACYYEHTDIVKYLLDCNCKVDLEDCGGQTALHVACSEGNIEIVSLLLERGCTINKLDLRKQTPLILGCKYAHLDVVKNLLKYDCEINAYDKFSEIRHKAVETGRKDMKVTIADTCDVNVIDTIGRTALHEACCKEDFDEEDEPGLDEDEIKDILSDINLDKHHIDSTKDESSDCEELIRKEIVELLLLKNVNIAIADMHRFTALHRAAESGYPTIVDVLLKKIIETNQISSLNADNPISLTKSPIPPIFVSGSRDVVNVFLQHNYDINIKDDNGRNALHYASEYSNLEVVQFLHDNGCNMNVVDVFGESVLHAACRGGNVGIIEYFLIRGCDIDHVNNEGETPYFRALRVTDIDVINILMKYNCDVNIINKRGQNASQSLPYWKQLVM